MGEISQAPTVDVEKAEGDRLRSGETPDPAHPVTVNEAGVDEVLEVQEAGPSLPFSKARTIALVGTVTGASFLNTLSVQIVVIILPTIGNDLNIPESRLQWVVSAYSLTFACFLMLWGRIADLYGKRKIFVLGSGFVAVCMIINPFMSNEIAFDLFRGLQGLGAAANVPTAIGILGTSFPPGKAKNYAFSAYAAGAPLGAVFGNLIAGFIASYANWRWVFGATGGLAIVVTIAGFFLIPPPPAHLKLQDPTKKQSLLKSVDWIGGALITAGLLALMFALTEGNVVGWSTVWIYMLIVIALLLIAAFAAWQWYQEKHTERAPLMKVSIFKNGRFVAANLIMGLSFGAFNDFLIYAAYLYQDYQGLSAIDTTLRFIPTGVFGIITAFIVSRLISRIPTWTLLITGNLCVSLSNLLFAVPIPIGSTSYFAFGFPAMILGVIGADTAWPCLTLFTSKTLPQQDQAMGGAIINASGQLGRAISLAITTAVQTTIMAKARGVAIEQSGSAQEWDQPTLSGLRAGHWFNFGLAVCCIVVVTVAFRGTGIVGKIEKPKDIPQRTSSANDADGIQEATDTSRKV